MVSLLDVAPSTKTVTVGGVNVPVFGVSAKGIASLLQDFPELRKAFAGKETDGFTAEGLFTLVPQAIASIIAAGTGHPGEADHIAAAEKLPADAQAELMEAIIALTMPKGVGPFMERVTQLTRAFDVKSGEESGKGPVTKSPSRVKS